MRRAITAFIAALAAVLTFATIASAATDYRVQPGDTLFLIAKKYGISCNDLQAANSLNTSSIYPGQTLVIPIPNSTGSNVSTNTNTGYIVQKGDTLFLIAQKYGVDYGQLQKANNLATTEIYPGQNLVITGTAEAEARTGTTLASRGSFSWRDLELMARIVNGEARGESFEGQVAVAAVILNRLQDADFPKTIAGVIYQPWAFTAVHDGQINASLTASAMDAVKAAINGWDPTNGATYYWNPVTATNQWVWTRSIIQKIGNHVFAK